MNFLGIPIILGLDTRLEKQTKTLSICSHSLFHQFESITNFTFLAQTFQINSTTKGINLLTSNLILGLVMGRLLRHHVTLINLLRVRGVTSHPSLVLIIIRKVLILIIIIIILILKWYLEILVGEVLRLIWMWVLGITPLVSFKAFPESHLIVLILGTMRRRWRRRRRRR